MPASRILRVTVLLLAASSLGLIPSESWPQTGFSPQQENSHLQGAEAPQAQSQEAPPAKNGEASQQPAQGPQTETKKPVQQPPAGDPKQQAWTLLEGAANGEKTGDRAAAIRALGLLAGNDRARRMAEKALKDEKPEVRTAAALALGDMQAKGSIPALKAATDDPEPSVALAAGQALCLLHDPAAYDVYYEVLTGERKTGTGLIASQKAILRDPKKLAEIGIAEGVGFIPFGGLGWEAIKSLTKDDTSPIRASAAKILASDPDPASAKALENAAGDKSWIVRAAALEALAKRGDPAVLKTVELYTYDEKVVVQYTAAAAYLHLTDIRDNPPPARAKRKPRPKVSRRK